MDNLEREIRALINSKEDVKNLTKKINDIVTRVAEENEAAKAAEQEKKDFNNYINELSNKVYEAANRDEYTPEVATAAAALAYYKKYNWTKENIDHFLQTSGPTLDFAAKTTTMSVGDSIKALLEDTGVVSTPPATSVKKPLKVPLPRDWKDLENEFKDFLNSL